MWKLQVKLRADIFVKIKTRYTMQDMQPVPSFLIGCTLYGMSRITVFNWQRILYHCAFKNR